MRAHPSLLSVCSKETDATSTLVSRGVSCVNHRDNESKQGKHRTPEGAGSGELGRAPLAQGQSGLAPD